MLVAPGASGDFRVRSEAYDRGSMMGGGMMGGSGASAGLTLATIAVKVSVGVVGRNRATVVAKRLQVSLRRKAFAKAKAQAAIDGTTR